MLRTKTESIELNRRNKMAFLGMRGTGDFVANQAPENWRETLLRLYPNGMSPLTAMLSKMNSKKLTDGPVFHWWTKQFPSQRGTVTGVYTTTDLSTPYAGGGVAGSNVYVKLSEADASQFRVGHQVLLRDASDSTVDVNAYVFGVQRSGANSYLACRLLEADDNSTINDLSDCDTVLVIGNANPEGSTIPDAIAYDPVETYNYTQIFQTSLEITRTAMRTGLRTPEAYKEAKREGLELHGVEMEKAAFWGVRYITTGPNGKPMRFTRGIIPSIKEFASDNVSNYSLDPAFAGKTWLQGGEEWLDTRLERIFRYGGSERMCYVGSGALLGLQKLVKATGQFTFTPMTTSYGIKVTEWITPFGAIYLKTHPLFSYEATTRNMMVLLEPKNITWNYIDDTFFKSDKSETQGGISSIDGRKEAWITEGGFEMDLPETAGLLEGIGVDNAG
jgi:hypothetical protein